MRAPTLRALARDALFQVLDNWVFRIMAVLTLLPILATYAFACREDGIVFLFGVQEWPYDQVLSAFGGGSMGIEDVQSAIIGTFVSLVFDQLVGTFGVLFCIAATAFFVPRMIEKGAADVLFHKPIGRLALYVSRYFAGLLFVGLLSTVLVVGVYSGILLVSGYNDPGILFAAFTLTYLFGLIFAVCMLIGVVTRSTVASILLTVIFFGFNGCVHSAWIGLEQIKIDSEIQDASAGPDDEEAAEEEGVDDASTIRRTFATALTTFHYVLPKTTDADALASKMRRAIDAPVFTDEEALATVFRMPGGAQMLDPGELTPALAPEDLVPLLGEPLFGMRSERMLGVLWRRAAESTETSRNGRTRVRRESAKAAADSLAEAVTPLASEALERESEDFGTNTKGVPASATILRWKAAGVAGPDRRVAVLFRGTDWDWFYTLVLESSVELSDDEWTDAFEEVDQAMGLDANVLRQSNWYEEQLTFEAEIPYNIFFSVGSSLAFAVAMLLLGWWRLTRIEF